MKKVRVGSRDSKLAVIQTELVLNEIQKKHPEIEFELITMKTTGDKILDRNLDQIGGKGLFVKELDKALLDGRVDITIHSLKDLPMEISEEIPLVGFSKREDPRDVLIFAEGEKDGDITGCIGTSSRRRMEQLKRIYPHASFRGIRGNVQTRLKKLAEEDYVATVLAKAGLNRLNAYTLNCLNTNNNLCRVFSVEEMIPAAGQGILAIQGRKGEDYSYLEDVCSRKSRIAALTERSFVRSLDGGCSSPIAAYAEVEGDLVKLRGLYYHEPAQDYSVGVKSGAVSDAEKIGIELAKELRAQWM